jgi:Enoyl-CoA hydratase/isomerase
MMRLLNTEASSNSPIAEWAQQTIDTLEARSPASIHVSNAAMRNTLNLTRYATFQREFELATAFMREPDFKTGVIARLIDRTTPAWSLSPSALRKDPRWVQSKIFDKGRYFDTLAESFYMLEEGKSDYVTMERGVFRYSLPTEDGVLATVMRGKTDGSVGEAVRFTRDELVEYILGERVEKPGAERKLNFILDRCTAVDAKGKVVWKFRQADDEE